MNVIIDKSIANGTVLAPPSKSVSHRALICAALSDGVSIIENIAFSDDVLATINCLRAIGAKIDVSETSVTVKGVKNFNNTIVEALNCNESGSTLRFMIPICWLFGKEIVLKGSKRLLERSLSVYEQIALEDNFSIKTGENVLTVCGKLRARQYFVKGNISSQFISGLLFALPLLENDSEIIFTTEIESRPYIDITIDCLNIFGIKIIFSDDKILIKGNQKYVSSDYTVEGDYSNTAFFDCMNYIGHNIKIDGLNPNSYQGDKVYEQMFSNLNNGFATLDISNCPDLAPILMTLAAIKNGAEFVGTKRLKIKESDRGEAMSSELSKFGIKTKILENSITVFPGKIQIPDKEIEAHNDHRIVMSMAVLLTLTGGKILNAQAVNKSFPDFFKIITDLGIKVTYETTE